MTIKISAIIPTYNRIKHLKKCILSIYKQTYPVDEVILVDNNSSDGTLDFIKNNFKTVRILVEKKRGVSYARNLGIIHSKNKWLAFLDSDDEWLDRKIEEQVKIIKNSNYKTELVHTNEKWIKNKKIKNQKKKHIKKGGEIFKECLVPNCGISTHSSQISITS